MKTTGIHYSFHKTQFGNALIASTLKGVYHVSFPQEEHLSIETIQHLLSSNEIAEHADSLHQQVADIIDNKTKDKTTIVLDVVGSDFQQKVWQAVMLIPYGETAKYHEIADKIGKSKAVRAVGTAIGKNNIAILIPCHRVICSSGKLGGYRWGTNLKKKILETENPDQAFR